MKQTIETKLGVTIILIVAVTVGAFVWKWEKRQDLIQQRQASSSISAQYKIGSKAKENVDANDKWKKYTSNDKSFSIEYPSNYIVLENSNKQADYKLILGPPQSKTVGSNEPDSPQDTFVITKLDNRNGINDEISIEKRARGECCEQSTEIVGMEEIGVYSAKSVKTCDMGGNCSKILYFMQGKNMYSVNMRNYFSTEDATRKIFDQMLSSIEFEK